MNDNAEARQMTENERAMLDRYTILGPRGQPRLVIDQQSFDIDNAGRPWQRERAEWYRRQMAFALARMVKAETDALAAENDAMRDDLASLKQSETDLLNEVERLRGILQSAVDAWDTHNETGDRMQGRWVSDARAALAKWEAAQK